MQSQNAINTHQGKCQSKGESPSSNGWENAHLNKYFSFLFLTSKRTLVVAEKGKKEIIIIKTSYTTSHQSFMMDRWQVDGTLLVGASLKTWDDPTFSPPRRRKKSKVFFLIKCQFFFFLFLTKKTHTNERTKREETSWETRANHFVTGMLMSKSNTKRETPKHTFVMSCGNVCCNGCQPLQHSQFNLRQWGEADVKLSNPAHKGVFFFLILEGYV